MEKQRKEKVDKKLILKAFIKALIFSIVLTGIVVVFVILLPIDLIGGVEQLNTQKFEIIIFFIILILGILALMIFILIFENFMDKEKGKISKKLVEDILTRYTYTEVYPKEGHLKYYQHFFYTGLPAKSKYFAILSEDEKEIVIVLKFDKYDEYIFLEWIEKDEFKDAYEIVETNKTTN